MTTVEKAGMFWLIASSFFLIGWGLVGLAEVFIRLNAHRFNVKAWKKEDAK